MLGAIAFRFAIAAVVVVPMWLLIGHSGGHGGPRPGSPAADLETNATLVQAAQLLGSYRQSYGTFAGANLSAIQGARLVRADVSSFCVESGEGLSRYHLDGTDREDQSWNWGAVKGPCATQ